MAVVELVFYPDEPLLDVAEEVTSFGPELAQLIQDLKDTVKYYEGVGLAAPQIGVSLRVFVIQKDLITGETSDAGTYVEVVNPEIEYDPDREDDKFTMEEGCLSLPGARAKVRRPFVFTLTYQDAQGGEHTLKVSKAGLQASAIQHEYDHLFGIMLPQRVGGVTRRKILKTYSAARRFYSRINKGYFS